MLNLESFNKIREHLEKEEEEREELIRESRIMIKDSKQAIYALHRGEMGKAEHFVEKMRNSLQKIRGKGLEITQPALQEYVEAAAFLAFEKEEGIPTPEELGVDNNSFLLGLCDLCGELVRKAVRSAIMKDYEETRKIKNLVEELHGQFLTLDLRNGELRKKSDGIKYHLKKLEEIIFTIETKVSI